MHSIFHIPAALRRRPARAAVPAVCAPACMLQLTVSTVSVTALRRLVMSVCGEALYFMRIEACRHGQRMRVWLSLSESAAHKVMEAVMRALPEAEFGRMSGAPARPAGALQ
jgi:hypothetical protein